MEKERIGVIAASLLGIISFFLPWISIDLGWGMGFSLNVFNLIDLAEWGYEAPGMFVWIAYVAMLLFAAALITSALYERLSPHIPHLKIIPLIVSIIGLIIAVVVVIGGSDALSPMNIFDFLGVGFYLFLIATVILFISALALRKKI